MKGRDKFGGLEVGGPTVFLVRRKLHRPLSPLWCPEVQDLNGDSSSRGTCPRKGVRAPGNVPPETTKVRCPLVPGVYYDRRCSRPQFWGFLCVTKRRLPDRSTLGDRIRKGLDPRERERERKLFESQGLFVFGPPVPFQFVQRTTL